jgi:hypothetical protein
MTPNSGDSLRVWISTANIRDLDGIAARIEALLGKRPSRVQMLRAAIPAFEAAVIAAYKEHGKATPENPSRKLYALKRALDAAVATPRQFLPTRVF